MNRFYLLAIAAIFPMLGCQGNQASKISSTSDGYDVCLDGKEIENVEKFHKAIKKQGEFPADYAETMDGLWEVLMSRVEPVRVTWYNYEKSEEALNADDSSFIRIKDTFKNAKARGSRSSLKLVDEFNSPENPCEKKDSSPSAPSNPPANPMPSDPQPAPTFPGSDQPVLTDPVPPVFN